jgi:outer membrane protein
MADQAKRWVTTLLLISGVGLIAEARSEEQLRLRHSVDMGRVPSLGDSGQAVPAPQFSAVVQTDSMRCQGLTLRPQEPLLMTTALELILCRSPAIRQAMASASEQAAGLALANLAWWPRFSLNAERASNRVPSSNSAPGSLNQSLTLSAGVSWILFDFGARTAILEQARQALTSALASQDVALIAGVREGLRLYVDAAAAWAQLEALEQAEKAAAVSAAAAAARHDAKVASLSERLQAQTAFSQARLDRVRGQGAWQSAAAALATALGEPPGTEILMPRPDQAFPELSVEVPESSALQTLVDTHPRVRALQADVLALRARLESVRADGRGTISLTGGAAQTRSADFNDRVINTSVVASIPLLNAREQSARISQAASQIESREASVEAARRVVLTEILTAVQQLTVQRQALPAARELLESATAFYDSAFGRYRAGVGSIVEMLSAQASLANARAQLVQARIALTNAQLTLTAATGRLGSTGSPDLRR